MIPQFKVHMNPEAVNKVRTVLGSGYIGQGARVEEFEERLKEKLGFSYGVTVNSGTAALTLALRLIGVGPGDSVVSTPMTCLATNAAITLTGADIVWADIDKYGNIDPESVSESIRQNTKAVMAVDWGGIPCDFDALRKAIDAAPARGTHDIPIIQDAAHAFGATYHGRPVAACADYTAFSFQAIKHLTTGDGGLLVTPASQYERAKLLRWYGLDRTSGDRMRCLQNVYEIGDKLHMNDIAAAIGLGNLESVDEVLAKHRENARYYNDIFSLYGELVEVPPGDVDPSYWIYTIHVPDPSDFERFMFNNGISVSKVHNRNDNYTAFEAYRKPLPNLDRWFSTMTCIPVGWWLTVEDRSRIAELVIRYITPSW